MPPRRITEATNPNLPTVEALPSDSRRGLLGGRLGAMAARFGGGEGAPSSADDLDMNVAESYGIRWDAEKCGRDAFQNFFDANGGTLDGVTVSTEVEDPKRGEGKPTYTLSISGDTGYDYRDLTVIGATTKKTGEHTAGGFGEGAKFLALSLLRDHDTERVIYRSRDWQLEFFIGDLPAERVARPTRGLFARVATGLKPIGGSTMVVTSQNEATVQSLYGAREFFRSSENPDFAGNMLEKTLPDGTQTGVKYIGVDTSGYSDRLHNGHLYVAGQRRHYSPYGRDAESWDAVRGLSVWTTKDIAPGDRDRGQISSSTLKDEIFKPLVQALSDSEVRTFFEAIESAYDGGVSGVSELADLAHMVAGKGEELGVSITFDPKYVACSPFQKPLIRDTMKKAGYTLCPDYYKRVGMKTDAEVLRVLHEHQRVEPSPEQQTRLDLLQKGMLVLTNGDGLKKEILPKDIWLYSKALEKNPFEATYNEEFVWMSEEHLTGEFATALATYLHELDHEHGDDSSAEFSYALTDTLAEVLHTIMTKPTLYSSFQRFAAQWQEVTPPQSTTKTHRQE